MSARFSPVRILALAASVTLIALLCLPVTAAPDTGSANTQIRLRHVLPSVVVGLLTEANQTQGRLLSGERVLAVADNALPPGLETLTPNDQQRTLSVSGSRAAVAEIQQFVRLVDVKAPTVRMKLRILRTPTDPAVSPDAAAATGAT